MYIEHVCCLRLYHIVEPGRTTFNIVSDSKSIKVMTRCRFYKFLKHTTSEVHAVTARSTIVCGLRMYVQ